MLGVRSHAVGGVAVAFTSAAYGARLHAAGDCASNAAEYLIPRHLLGGRTPPNNSVVCVVARLTEAVLNG